MVRPAGTDSRAVPIWVAGFNPFRTGASIGYHLSLRYRRYAERADCSPVSPVTVIGRPRYVSFAHTVARKDRENSTRVISP